MGIKNMMKIINKYAEKSIKKRSINEYTGKTIGIDTNLLIYKMVYAIRRNGYDIKNGDENVTHIYALLNKLIQFEKYKITPIFVFDNESPKMKEFTLKNRTLAKDKMKEKYKNAKSKEDKKIKYYINSVIKDQDVKECRELITLFGYSIIDAKEEADGQLVELYKKKLIDYIASDDLDLLVYGGEKILKNFTVSVNKQIDEINLNKLLQLLKFDQSMLINLGILLGSDYCDIKNVSPIKAYNLITKYKKISKIPNTELLIDKLSECEAAIKYFKGPPVNKITKINPPIKNTEGIKNFLKKHNFKKETINKFLK